MRQRRGNHETSALEASGSLSPLALSTRTNSSTSGSVSVGDCSKRVLSGGALPAPVTGVNVIFEEVAAGLQGSILLGRRWVRRIGCGCEITLHTVEEESTFYRGDCAWSLVKDSDGRDLGDGSTVYDAHETLSVSLKTVHPQQLADSILRIVANDQQKPAGFIGGLRGVPTGGS